MVSPESQWALVVVDKEKPDMIYTSTRGLPLLVGFGDHGDQLYVASEKIAFQEHADCYFAMNDREIYELRIDHLEGLKQEMKKSDRLYNIDKSKKESKDPPPPFKRFYDYELRQIGTLPFKPCFGRMKILKFGDNLTMVACGSSNYAAGTSEYFFKLLKCFKKIHIYDPV